MDPLAHATQFIAAAAALGTAAFAVVDASKVFRGGISNAGFNHLQSAMARFAAALRFAQGVDLFQTLKANWLNGKALADQKATAKSLIRLGITSQTAGELEKAVGLPAGALVTAAQHVEEGADLTEEDINILGRFDSLVSAIVDQGYERADQLYRNSAKTASAVVAVLLAWGCGLPAQPIRRAR
jgi:hypothetical protein